MKPRVSASHRSVGISDQEKWSAAVQYFRSRKTVIFINHNRFWQVHGFAQQSLAKHLTAEGVEVIWFDSVGFGSYRPVVHFPSPRLKVRELFKLPMTRLPVVKKINDRMQTLILKRLIKSHGNPVVWIQSHFDEGIIARLPYVDVYSTFDTPDVHDPRGPLCEKAKLILCQNTYAYNFIKSVHPEKAKLALPPVELVEFRGQKKLDLPAGFPKRRMGYVGSVFPHYFDFDLFRVFVESLPDWGFILQGRTDERGKAIIEDLKRFKNFIYLDWVPQEKLEATWRALDVCLLLYRDQFKAPGGFPSKVLEALHFGIPSVGTEGPCTADLAAFFPMETNAKSLMRKAVRVADWEKPKLKKVYEHFLREMNPQLYLAKVADWLQNPERYPLPFRRTPER